MHTLHCRVFSNHNSAQCLIAICRDETTHPGEFAHLHLLTPPERQLLPAYFVYHHHQNSSDRTSVSHFFDSGIPRSVKILPVDHCSCFSPNAKYLCLHSSPAHHLSESPGSCQYY